MSDNIPDGSALEDAVPWWHVEIGREERNLVDEALAKNLFSQGPVAQTLESELAESTGAAFAVCTTSGSTALLMSMMALGVGPGDRVRAARGCRRSPRAPRTACRDSRS